MRTWGGGGGYDLSGTAYTAERQVEEVVKRRELLDAYRNLCYCITLQYLVLKSASLEYASWASRSMVDIASGLQQQDITYTGGRETRGGGC